MDQDKTEPKPQSLLEAAKAVADIFTPRTPAKWYDLRAAIARAESETMDFHKTNLPHIDRARKAEDRAQQAEADAAWRKAEGERLSAELALAKNQMTLAIERSERLSGQLRGCEYDLGQAGKLRQRAEKAEAELTRVGKQLARLVELQANPPIAVTQPFEGDPQTCAFGSNVVVGKTDPDPQDVRDPATGWTFATYRRVVEALGSKS